MDLTEKLRAWGTAHAQARNAEWAAASQPGKGLARQAQMLRQQADTLHREIYRQIGEKRHAAA